MELIIWNWLELLLRHKHDPWTYRPSSLPDNSSSIRCFSSSRVFLNAPKRFSSDPAAAAGSGNPQCNRRAFPKNTGHSSSPQSVITVSTCEAGISATGLDLWLEMSIPISRRTEIASGRTEVGREPADQTLTPGGAIECAIPSAIWLRAELATHRNRMPFILSRLHSIIFTAKPQGHVNQPNECRHFNKRSNHGRKCTPMLDSEGRNGNRNCEFEII